MKRFALAGLLLLLSLACASLGRAQELPPPPPPQSPVHVIVESVPQEDKWGSYSDWTTVAVTILGFGIAVFTLRDARRAATEAKAAAAQAQASADRNARDILLVRKSTVIFTRVEFSTGRAPVSAATIVRVAIENVGLTQADDLALTVWITSASLMPSLPPWPIRRTVVGPGKRLRVSLPALSSILSAASLDPAQADLLTFEIHGTVTYRDVFEHQTHETIAAAAYANRKLVVTAHTT